MKVTQKVLITTELSQHDAWKLRMIIEDWLSVKTTEDGFKVFAGEFVSDLKVELGGYND